MGRHVIPLEEDCRVAWTALEQRGGPETLAETLCWSDVVDLFPSRQRVEAARREGHLPGDQLRGSGGAWRASRSNFVTWLREMHDAWVAKQTATADQQQQPVVVCGKGRSHAHG